MTHSLNTNNILHEERKESELITFINELRLLANEEVLYDNKKKDEKIRERLLSRIEQNPEEIKRLLGGINRQFEADKYLLKILEQANPEKNIQHIFTTEEVSFGYNTKTGALFYDADGSGVGEQVQIALIANKAALVASDILV